jgi:hypothetical protein
MRYLPAMFVYGLKEIMTASCLKTTEPLLIFLVAGEERKLKY